MHAKKVAAGSALALLWAAARRLSLQPSRSPSSLPAPSAGGAGEAAAVSGLLCCDRCVRVCGKMHRVCSCLLFNCLLSLIYTISAHLYHFYFLISPLSRCVHAAITSVQQAARESSKHMKRKDKKEQRSAFRLVGYYTAYIFFMVVLVCTFHLIHSIMPTQPNKQHTRRHIPPERSPPLSSTARRPRRACASRASTTRPALSCSCGCWATCGGFWAAVSSAGWGSFPSWLRCVACVCVFELIPVDFHRFLHKFLYLFTTRTYISNSQPPTPKHNLNIQILGIDPTTIEEGERGGQVKKGGALEKQRGKYRDQDRRYKGGDEWEEEG